MRHTRVLAIVLGLAVLVSGAAVAAGRREQAAQRGPIRIAILVKNLGNSFFEAVRDGALEAAKEIGGVEIIYQGPSTPTAEGQITIVDTLIAQRVDGIAISANDRDALVPVLRRAMAAGIEVISFDSGVAVGGRIIDLKPSNEELIGRQQVQLIADLINYEGEIAILSASSQATNQNAWIRWMQEELKDPKYARMRLVATVYGDDLSDKSYREALGLFRSHPNLRGIIAPTTVGIAAASKAIEDQGLTGRVQITGLGLPSEMRYFIEKGICGKMALWNPIDLGYTATYIVNGLVRGMYQGREGEVIKAGRMGEIRVGRDGDAVMSTPYVFDRSNIAKFSAIF